MKNLEEDEYDSSDNEPAPDAEKRHNNDDSEMPTPTNQHPNLNSAINLDMLPTDHDLNLDEAPSLFPHLDLDHFPDQEQGNQPQSVQHRLMVCPICNKGFNVEDIENHAQICLESIQTPFIALQNSLAISLDNETETTFNIQEYMDTPLDIDALSKKELLQSIKETFVDLKLNNSSFISLHIRRGNEFNDFHKFFNKKWNKRKIGEVIKISYIGEKQELTLEGFPENFTQV